MTDQETAGIGDNNPPETPFEISQSKIQDLYDEAALWLDGDPINSEEMAEGIATLLQSIRAAAKEAEDERAAEKKPHWDAGKAVDVKWKPLTTLADRATEAAKAALAPWLKKKADEKAEEDRRLREEAERKKAEAEKAIREANRENVLERQAAEDKLEEAKKAEVTANKAARESAGVKGRTGRAVSLRKRYRAVLRDPEAALEHYWPHVRIEELLTSMAQADADNGKANIPGFEIKIEHGAV